MDKREKAREYFIENLHFIGEFETTVEEVDYVFHAPKIRKYIFEEVRFPSGEIIIGDPLSYLQSKNQTSYLVKDIESGSYPIEIGIIHSDVIGLRMTGMKLKISNEEPISYELVETYFIDDGEKKEAMPGLPVEAGMATICDKKAVESYWDFVNKWHRDNPQGNIYDDYFAMLFAQSYQELPDLQTELGDFIRFEVPGTDQEMVMVSSGFGDGFYSAFWGHDKYDHICELVIRFINPKLLED